MRCRVPRRNDQSRSVPRARWRRRAGRLRPTRRLTIRAQAAGTLIAALAPVTAAAGASERSAPPAAISWAACGTQLECARVPFDPGFGHGPAAR